MSLMFRACPECGGDQLFEQYHDAPGTCPDAADGHCPEWSCTACGAAFLAGFLPGNAEPAQAEPAQLSALVQGRVA